MTFLAGSLARPGGKNSLVEIAMAIAAGRKFQGRGRRSCTMALLTSDFSMQSPQRKTGLVMIKFRSLNSLPPVGNMATLAIGAQSPFVNISVAGRTWPEFDRLISPEFPIRTMCGIFLEYMAFLT